MNKKAIAILGAIFLLIVGTLGFLIYAKYHKSGTPAAVTTTASSTTVAISPTPAPTPTGPPFVQLTQTQVVSPVLFYNGGSMTYFDNSGNLYQADINTSTPLQLVNVKSIDITPKSGITKIYWPPQGNSYFIAESKTSTSTVWSTFNNSTGVYTGLPPQVISFDWAPSGTQIYFVWLQNGQATLNIANPDTTNYKEITNLDDTDDSIHVSPDGKNILFYHSQNSGDTNNINMVDVGGTKWQTVVSTGYNYGVLWSPDSQKFLFAKKDLATGNYQLWVYNFSTGAVQNLGFYTTVDKAVWGNDSQTVYAAVPVTGVPGEGLTTDTFYKININDFSKETYQPSSSQNIDGQDLFLSTDGTKLFFQNAQDGYLYYVDVSN